MTLLANILAVVGYPVAIVCITRLVPVFRQRRTRWLVAHELGTAAIVASWILRGNPLAIVINSAWLIGVGVAWVVSGRRRDGAPVTGAPSSGGGE